MGFVIPALLQQGSVCAAQGCCVVPVLLHISEGRLTALTLVCSYFTWNAGESSCGAAKSTGEEQGEGHKKECDTERKVGKYLIRDYSVTKEDAAVPEEGCCGGVLHSCIPPLLLIFPGCCSSESVRVALCSLTDLHHCYCS